MADAEPLPTGSTKMIVLLRSAMTERTTLLLVHLGSQLYGVDFSSQPGRPLAGELEPRGSWRFEDVLDSLGSLGWEIEDDQQENAYRRLFLRRG